MRWLLPLWLIPTWLILWTAAPPPAMAQDPPAAPAPEEAVAEEPPEDDNRITFAFQLSGERGGGRVECWAGDFEYKEDDYLLATEGVRIKYKDLQIQADTVRIDIRTDLMTAEGSVVLDEGPSRLVGDTLEYNLSTRTGKVTEATAYVDTSYVFKGREIAKVAEGTYTLDEGVFTSCSQDNPPWSIHMGHARITVEDYARLRNARMKLGKVPIFAVPRLLWPTKTERSSGFLVPQPGYSERRGFELSLAYFKTFGRSADATFFTDLSTEEYFGFGTEARYKPSETTDGIFELFVIQDQDFKRIGEDPTFTPPANFTLPDETRWKASWLHESRDLWGGFRGVLNFQDYSDPTYRQDFERGVNRQAANFIYSQAYLTRNLGQQSLNILVDLRERLRTEFFVDPDPAENGEVRRIGRITDTRRQLPEIEYRIRPTQLGSTQLYFSLDANLHYFSLKNNTTRPILDPTIDPALQDQTPVSREYGRGDLLPSFSIPLSTLPWLSVKVDVGGRVTHYTNSLVIDPDDRSDRRFPDEDKELTRSFGLAGAEIVGPSFSRIFEKKKPGRFSKLKHIIEPRFVYSYFDDFEDAVDDGVLTEADEVPLFDEIDSRRLRNEASVSLINRILAKPTNEEEGGGFEIASFELRQSFSFDSNILLQRGTSLLGQRETSDEGPIRGIFRFNPSQSTSLKVEGTYNTLFGQMQALSLSGGARFGPHNLGGSLFTRWGTAEDADITSNQARVFASLALVPDRLRFDVNLIYDIEKSELLQQRYFLDFEGSCYSLRFEVRESTLGIGNDAIRGAEDRDFRFSFTLKNVGTFIDLNGSL